MRTPVTRAFNFGGEDAEFVRVSSLSDNGDGWLSAQVDVAVGGFRGSYPADFNSWAFSDFHAQLKSLYLTLSGSAVFSSYEKQLEFTLTCNPRGSVRLSGEATDLVGSGNRLLFELQLDQTYLPAIINELQSALERFPPGDVR